MAKIIVLGAGVCGLAAGILLRRDGHEVTVLERDPEPPPASLEDAWERWSRDGVTQFHQAHLLLARGRGMLEEALPDVLASLEAHGAVPFDPLLIMPPSITDRTPREGDERFGTVNARRPVFEQVLAQAADAEPGLDIRRGVSVAGLLARARQRQAPTGARRPYRLRRATRRRPGRRRDREAVAVSALARGRRGWPGPRGEPRTRVSSTTRASSAPATERSPRFRAGVLTPIGTFSLLTIPSDNETWSVTLYTASGDQPVKRLRDPGPWTAVIRACPAHAHWLEGEPISDLIAMGGILDRYRRPRRRREAGRDRGRADRRCLGVHEPVAGTRYDARPAARQATGRRGPRAPG